MMEPSRVVDDPDAREEPPEPADEPGDEQAETAEDLFEPCDEEDDLTYIIADGPQGVRGRGMPGKYVYSYTFTHPGPKSIARGLCSPSEISKDETMARVQKAYKACDIDLQETAVFREPHKNGLPHDAVLCPSQVRHKWLPICTYAHKTWNMRIGASTHIKTWSDGCKYFDGQRRKEFDLSKAK